MQIVIGTRGSKLALAQAEFVQKKLTQAYPGDDFVLKIIKTKGDRIQDAALDKIGDKGVFVRDIEKELLAGSIDLAVHSMKDMPSELPRGLCFAKAWAREDARDVLVSNTADHLAHLKKHAVIGTGSKRRAFQLRMLREDLQIVNIRGNVDTRIEKMYSENLDGIVLAAAGLKRLGKESLAAQYFKPEEIIPAAAQGQLAIEMRLEDAGLLAKVNTFADKDAEKILQAERLFLQKTGGGCHMPAGAYGRILQDGKIELLAFFGREDGSRLAKCRVAADTPEEAAGLAAKECLQQVEERN